MSPPFEILRFFSKLETFQLVNSFDKQFDIQGKNIKGKDKRTWDIEKKILRWTYEGHKYLGHSIQTTHLQAGNFQTDVGLTKEEISKMKGLEKEILENLNKRGFAKFNNGNCVFTNLGLSMGTVIWETYSLSNEKILEKTVKYHLYNILILAMWPAFFAVVALAIIELIRVIISFFLVE